MWLWMLSSLVSSLHVPAVPTHVCGVLFPINTCRFWAVLRFLKLKEIHTRFKSLACMLFNTSHHVQCSKVLFICTYLCKMVTKLLSYMELIVHRWSEMITIRKDVHVRNKWKKDYRKVAVSTQQVSTMTVSGKAIMMFGAVFTDQCCAYCGLCWASREQWVETQYFVLFYNNSFFINVEVIDDSFILLAANDKDRVIKDYCFVCHNCK